jgi:hypothetical protein
MTQLRRRVVFGGKRHWNIDPRRRYGEISFVGQCFEGSLSIRLILNWRKIPITLIDSDLGTDVHP